MKSLNTRTTLFVTAVNVLIVLLIGFVIYTTLDPLALLGLFFLQNLPVFQEMPQQMEMMGYDGGEAPTAPADDYDDTKAGFTARL